MLVLARNVHSEFVCIVGGVRITGRVTKVRGYTAWIAFDAPPEVRIHRGEVIAELDAEKLGEHDPSHPEGETYA
jgi:sRNA-binding carbon storage regulator CsrA